MHLWLHPNIILSSEILFDLKNGTSAPNDFAILAIFSSPLKQLSYQIILILHFLLSKIIGFPLKSLIFLFLIARPAGIITKFIIYFFNLSLNYKRV